MYETDPFPTFKMMRENDKYNINNMSDEQLKEELRRREEKIVKDKQLERERKIKDDKEKKKIPKIKDDQYFDISNLKKVIQKYIDYNTGYDISFDNNSYDQYLKREEKKLYISIIETFIGKNFWEWQHKKRYPKDEYHEEYAYIL